MTATIRILFIFGLTAVMVGDIAFSQQPAMRSGIVQPRRAKKVQIEDPLKGLRDSMEEDLRDYTNVPKQKKFSFETPNTVRDPYEDDDFEDISRDDKPFDPRTIRDDLNTDFRREQLSDLGGELYDRDFERDTVINQGDDRTSLADGRRRDSDEADFLEGRDNPLKRMEDINESMRKNQIAMQEREERRQEAESRNPNQNRIAAADTVTRPVTSAPLDIDNGERKAEVVSASAMSESYNRFLAPNRGVEAARNADSFLSGYEGNAISDIVRSHTAPKPSYTAQVKPEADKRKFTLDFGEKQADSGDSFARLEDVGKKFSLPTPGSSFGKRGFERPSDLQSRRRSLLGAGESRMGISSRPAPSVRTAPKPKPSMIRKPQPEYKSGFKKRGFDKGFGDGLRVPGYLR